MIAGRQRDRDRGLPMIGVTQYRPSCSVPCALSSKLARHWFCPFVTKKPCNFIPLLNRQ